MKKLLVIFGCVAVAAANAAFTENFDGGTQQFAFSNNVGATVWAWVPADAANAHSGTGYMNAPQIGTVNDTLATSPVIAGNAVNILSFWQKRGFETPNYDGGVVEININGAGWVDVGDANWSSNGYTATISTSFANPIGGRRAFCGTVSTYVQSQCNLVGVTAADTFRIRFRSCNDNSAVGSAPWRVDDVVVDSNPGPMAISSVTMNPTAVDGGAANSTGTVTLNQGAGAGGETINLVSSNPAAASVPASIVIPATSTSGTFTATTSSVVSATVVTITATCTTGSANSVPGTLTVNPLTLINTIVMSPTPVVGGGFSTGTITLNHAPGGSGHLVNLVSSNPAVASVPASVTVAAAATTATFTATTFSVVASTAITITGTGPNNNQPAALQVDPAPAPPANSWVEVALYQGSHGDAGELIGTAQHTIGTGALEHILGSIATNDHDMFCITITDPATFSASTVGGTTLDTQLFLFKPDGTGIVMDDDEVAPGTTLQSKLTAGNPLLTALTAGQFYLAIAIFDGDPVDSGLVNELWLDTVGGSYAVEHAPDGLGMANPIAGWDSTTSTTGYYDITLTGAGYCDPPIVTVLPTSFTTSPGIVLVGGITEATSSDDVWMQVRPGAVFSNATDPVQVNFTGNAPGSTPTSLQVVTECRSTATNIKMKVMAFDYTLGTPNYVQVGATVDPLPGVAGPDNVSTFTLSPALNIGAGNEMKVRLSCRANGAVFSYPWKLYVDQVKWLYTP